MGLNLKNDWVSLSVSTQAFQTKPNFGSIRYTKRVVSISQFIELIQNGHCFCHLFKTAEEEFGTKEKTIANFKKASFLWFDCDNAPLTVNEAFEKLKFKPNIAYTTFSNGYEGKGYRYRFIYLTDLPIQSDEEYKTYLGMLYASISSDLGSDFMKCIDGACFNVSQQMMGSNKECTVLQNSNFIFGQDTFTDIGQSINDGRDKCIHFHNLNKFNKEKEGETITPNQALNTLVEKVRSLSEQSNFTPLLSNLNKVEYDTENVYTNVEQQDIYEIKFWFEDGKEKKVPQGTRSRFLFTCSIVLKNIKPQITIEELGANLWWIYCNKCETTKEMTLKDICRIVIGSFQVINPEMGKRKYVIAPLYRNLSKEDKMKHLGMARRRSRNQKVMSSYDFSKTAKENALEIGVSENTIHNALKDSNISLNREKYLWFCEVYKANQTESVRNLGKLCGIAPSTVERYKKRYMQEAAEQ